MRLRLTLCAAACASLPVLAAPPEQDLSRVEVKSSTLAPGLLLLQGSGGNIAALTGSEGVLLVDDEFAPLAGRIGAALKAAGASESVRFVVNTHYHFDHTDGNAAFARSGATIIAQDNLRTRLAAGGTIGNGGSIAREVAPAEAAALPTITYRDELTVHLDGEAVRVHHYAHAHTDGDSVVFFPGAKAVHMGDIYVRYGFPFIDVNGGGNVRGMIEACADVVRSVPADTRVIPGHGAVASIEDLRGYLQMLTDTTRVVSRALARGQTLEQMKQAQLLKDWSARYSPEGAFVNTDAFLESLYNSLQARQLRHGPEVRPH
ncbi:MAG TPA: MBL fold metallo-hydrolase [Steroidobacteraceae bacterium]|nr:MBL fold metallo-hydrolase [Steroidobacteraceae bacterium]